MTRTSGSATMAVAALILALSSIGSRVLGYLRDVIIATQLGASAETDAYYAAFGLPDFLVYFLAGGALSIAFVPIFQRICMEKSREDAWRLFRNIATVGVLIFAVALTVAYTHTDALVAVFVPEFSDAQHALTVRLTRIILPTPVFFFLGGLLGATEIAERRFKSTALAPLIYNACIIAGGLLLAPVLGVEGFSWGVLAGAALGPFGTQLWFARHHVDLRPLLDPRDPELRAYIYVALPLMLGVSLTTVDEWFGRYFASGLESGSISWLNNARRLMLFPIALLGQAIGQAALPFLSKLASEGDDDGLHQELATTLSSTALLSAAVAVGLAALSTIAVGVVYGYGAYQPDDVQRTGTLLAALCVAIPAWSLQAVAARGFYARSHTWLPMLASTLAVALAFPFYQLLQARYGVTGLALAAGIAMTGQLVVLLVCYQWAYKRSLWGAVIPWTVRGVLLALPGAALGGWVAATFWSPGDGAQATLVIAAISSVAYAVLCLPLLLAFGGGPSEPLRRRVRGLWQRLRR